MSPAPLSTDIVGLESDEGEDDVFCLPCSEAVARREEYDLNYSIAHGLLLRVTRDSARRRSLKCWNCSRPLAGVEEVS